MEPALCPFAVSYPKERQLGVWDKVQLHVSCDARESITHAEMSSHVSAASSPLTYTLHYVCNSAFEVWNVDEVVLSPWLEASSVVIKKAAGLRPHGEMRLVCWSIIYYSTSASAEWQMPITEIGLQRSILVRWPQPWQQILEWFYTGSFSLWGQTHCTQNTHWEIWAVLFITVQRK